MNNKKGYCVLLIRTCVAEVTDEGVKKENYNQNLKAQKRVTSKREVRDEMKCLNKCVHNGET